MKRKKQYSYNLMYQYPYNLICKLNLGFMIKNHEISDEFQELLKYELMSADTDKDKRNYHMLMMYYRYGLPLAEIGAEYHISRQAVQIRIKKMINRICHPTRIIRIANLIYEESRKEKYEQCGTTGEYEPLIKFAESTAPETVTEIKVVATAITTETIAEVITVVTEATAEKTLPETVTETVAEIAEEMQETEEQTEQETTEESTEDIVYINYSWDDDYYFDDFTVTAEDYILLCNCVAHEAGSDWYSDREKAKVVEVIFNRIWSFAFLDTVYEVITQPNQFAGSTDYANLDSYSYEVTSLCCDGVDLYLSNPDLFNEGYLFFYGDDDANYFY